MSSLPPPPPPPPAPRDPWPASSGPAGWAPQAAPHTDGLAIASLVCGIVGFTFCFIPSVVAIVLGFVSRSRIRQANGRLRGGGMALAGIICGFVGVAFLAIVILLVAFAPGDS